jgi:hypothetical protein
MLKQLLSIFSSNSVHRLALVTSIGANIIKTFEQEFAQDNDAKNAAIDTLVALLLAHKTTVTVSTTPPVTPSGV